MRGRHVAFVHEAAGDDEGDEAPLRVGCHAASGRRIAAAFGRRTLSRRGREEHAVRREKGEILFLDGKILFEDGEILFADGEILFEDGEILFADGRILFADGAFLSGFVAILSGFVAVLSGFVAILSGFVAILSGFVAFLSGFVAFLSGFVAFLSGFVAILEGFVALPRPPFQLPTGFVAILSGFVAVLSGFVAILLGFVAVLLGSLTFLRGFVAFLRGSLTIPETDPSIRASSRRRMPSNMRRIALAMLIIGLTGCETETIRRHGVPGITTEGVPLPNKRDPLVEQVEKDPKNAKAWFELGLFDEQGDRLDDALHEYEKGNELLDQSRYTGGNYLLARVSFKRRDFERSIGYLNAIFALEPRDPAAACLNPNFREGHYLRGAIHYELEQWPQAKAELGRFLELGGERDRVDEWLYDIRLHER